jgi:hypothetical protein
MRTTSNRKSLASLSYLESELWLPVSMLSRTSISIASSPTVQSCRRSTVASGRKELKMPLGSALLLRDQFLDPSFEPPFLECLELT